MKSYNLYCYRRDHKAGLSKENIELKSIGDTKAKTSIELKIGAVAEVEALTETKNINTNTVLIRRKM